ncbi:Stage II sporulation protein E (SpoIIE) [Thermomonospora echinospora]|uniref:Stage II sporulation protein E (SpoIIE) n=1 Tax=Thermomonospora echinospora TaxID=1992 RepID=A0A1H5S2P3_9ACTN|nr:PP2C family protein-serine/threonine phosphatase [Thermomonospora echinospora]SEF44624.1 Stage II sporulation protein E (SpoIIE) [Thermomonospora echinospora]
MHTPDDLEESRAGGLGNGVLLLWLVGLPVVIMVLTLLSPAEARLALLLIFLPPYISGRGTVRQTAATAVWAGLLVVISVIADPLSNPVTGATVCLLSLALGAWSVVSCRRRIAGEERILRLRSAAATLQRQILRPLPLRTDQLVVDGMYEPAEEDSMVGGDVYEVIASPYGSRVLIADVQGKGLRAIGMALTVLGAFREAAYWQPDLLDVVDALESAVVRQNAFAKEIGERERFVTALVLGFDDGPRACAVNCGHVPPYILDQRTGTVLRHEAGVPLGLGALVPESRTVEWFDFPAGATLLLCTDGITEARDSSGAFYPLADRLGACHGTSPSEVVSFLRTELRRYTRERFRDDIAVLTLRRAHAAVPA